MDRERLEKALRVLGDLDEFLAEEQRALDQLRRRAGRGDPEARQQLAEIDRRAPKETA